MPIYLFGYVICDGVKPDGEKCTAKEETRALVTMQTDGPCLEPELPQGWDHALDTVINKPTWVTASKHTALCPPCAEKQAARLAEEREKRAAEKRAADLSRRMGGLPVQPPPLDDPHGFDCDCAIRAYGDLSYGRPNWPYPVIDGVPARTGTPGTYADFDRRASEVRQRAQYIRDMFARELGEVRVDPDEEGSK